MFGRSRKLMLIAFFTALIIILVNLAWWVFYNRTEVLLDKQLSRRLSAIARTTSASFTPEIVQALISGDLEAYMKVTLVLEQALHSDSLSETFIISDNYLYIATTLYETDSSYFLTELNAPYIDSLFYGMSDGIVVTPSYKTGKIYLRSAFAPLLDSDGSIVAVLGVEADVDYFDSLADLRQNLYFSVGLSVVGGLLFGLLFILFQRRINSAEQILFMNETQVFMGRMVAVVAHEIRNPLMIIRASAERLAKKHREQENQFIIEEVDRLNEIVSGYLDFARGTEGTFVKSGKTAKINLEGLVVDLRKYLRDKYPSEDIIWLENNNPSDLVIESYPRSLRQVLLNLLINSADACLAASCPIELGIAVEEKENTVVVTVKDHGPGITGKNVARLFEPFYTTKQSGSGLGLYLSKKIVAEMGGEIDIKSRSGTTEVIITLPKTPGK